jgi:tripartite-type tricarboxylate transporter receptor subunit TctC
MKRTGLWMTVFSLMFWASALGAQQAYPDKPVRMVVPFPPGGPLDVVARLFAVPMSERFGQSVLVENRAGATGNIGMDAVARAQPDGHTLLWMLDSMLTVNPIVFPQFGEPMERLRPIRTVTETTATLAVNPDTGVSTVADFIKLTKARDLSYASAGPGSPGHRTMEFFMLLTGARLTHVPYNGNAPAVQSLMAGQTQAFITPITGVLSQVRAGKLRALMVSSAQRSPLLPEVPTMVELGYKRYVIATWFSLFAPAKTPQSVIDVLDREVVRVIQLPEVRERLLKTGADPISTDARAITARVAEERKLWAEVIEKTGMKVE